MKTIRKKISSGSLFEEQIGFSRAIRIGNSISVSGTAPIADDGSTAHSGNVHEQTKRCIEIMKMAIEESGGRLNDVIRTRIMLVDILSWEDAARAHSEYFKDIRPRLLSLKSRALSKPIG